MPVTLDIELKEASRQDVIEAFGRLMEFTANKRSGFLSNELGHDQVASLASKINSSVFKKHGLDILQVDDIDAINQYSDLIFAYTSDFVSENLGFNGLEEQVAFINDLQDVSTSEFIDMKITFSNNALSEVLKGIKLIKPAAITLAKHPHYAQRIPGDHNFLDSYLLTAVTVLANRKVILLINANSDDLNQGKAMSINTAFAFSYDQFEDMLNSPIRLFLKLFDYYGVDIKIADQTKRFYYKAVFDDVASSSTSVFTYSYSKQVKGKVSAGFIFKKEDDTIYMSHAYGLNITDYLKDYRTGRI